MARRELGSLTKEFPLEAMEETIQAIVPDMPYSDLLTFARDNTRGAAPGLLRQRLLLVDAQERIVFDHFLSLANSEGIRSSRVRKVMYFVWAYRDPRIRRFICEVIAGRDGKWRPNQVVSKANASFFEQWYGERPSRKARSNFEYFVHETGVFRDGSVHLELDDGWLFDAMTAAAQHESDTVKRLAMAHAPIEFLISNGLNALANATGDELRALVQGREIDVDPVEDDAIEVTPAQLSASRPWNRSVPPPRSKQSTTAPINSVAQERASNAHWSLEKIMSDAARGQKYEPLQNAHIDLYFATPKGTALVEIKSCHGKNVHGQVRRGIGQLLEYRYVYSKQLGDRVCPVLLIERKPPPTKMWLIEFLDQLGMTLAWKDRDSERIVTSSTIPRALVGIVHPEPA